VEKKRILQNCFLFGENAKSFIPNTPLVASTLYK